MYTISMHEISKMLFQHFILIQSNIIIFIKLINSYNSLNSKKCQTMVVYNSEG